MKKIPVLISLIILSSVLQAAILPSYDFTFYATADNTLTSFSKENVGIDITGYGFVGKTASRGIYVRIGIQTPFETLVKLKESLFGKNDGDKMGKDSVPIQAETLVADSGKEKSSTITIESSSKKSRDDTERKKTEAIDPAKWKFLLTMGPAWRTMIDSNAMIYAGIGLSVSTDYINDFTYENGDYYSSFSAVIGTDMDTGFRIGISGSSTTIRIGVHFITDIAGYSSLKVYDKDRIVISTENSVYGYIAGKKGIAAATTARGYVRLAKTINEKRKVKYNYSNTTSRLGGGRVETIVL